MWEPRRLTTLRASTVSYRDSFTFLALYYTQCQKMGAHNLNIFIQKLNRARKARFSPHDSGTVAVLRKILVLPSAHECAHASVSGHLDTGWTMCEQQRELRSKCNEIEKNICRRGRRVFLSSCFMWWNLYSLSSVHFLNKNVEMSAIFLGHSVHSVWRPYPEVLTGFYDSDDWIFGLRPSPGI
jgi:hypothetical protein